MAADGGRRTGGCLCGAVRYEVAGALRPVIMCHCRQCRRTHGHVAAYTAAPRAAVTLLDERGLDWFESSPGVRRGFCKLCGSSLFWERLAGGNRSIAAGTLDDQSGWWPPATCMSPMPAAGTPSRTACRASRARITARSRATPAEALF